MTEAEQALMDGLNEAIGREREVRLALRELVRLDEERRRVKREYRRALHNAVAVLHRGDK